MTFSIKQLRPETIQKLEQLTAVPDAPPNVEQEEEAKAVKAAKATKEPSVEAIATVVEQLLLTQDIDTVRAPGESVNPWTATPEQYGWSLTEQMAAQSIVLDADPLLAQQLIGQAERLPASVRQDFGGANPLETASEALLVKLEQYRPADYLQWDTELELRLEEAREAAFHESATQVYRNALVEAQRLAMEAFAGEVSKRVQLGQNPEIKYNFDDSAIVPQGVVNALRGQLDGFAELLPTLTDIALRGDELDPQSYLADQPGKFSFRIIERALKAWQAKEKERLAARAAEYKQQRLGKLGSLLEAARAL